MSDFRKVMSADALEPGASVSVEIEGQRIALFNVDGNVYAIDDVCPHQGGPLGEGALSGCYVTCPWHAWDFDVTTGELDGDPETQVETFDVRVEGGDILIRL